MCARINACHIRGIACDYPLPCSLLSIESVCSWPTLPVPECLLFSGPAARNGAPERKQWDDERRARASARALLCPRPLTPQSTNASGERSSAAPEAQRGGRPWGRPSPPLECRAGAHSGAAAERRHDRRRPGDASGSRAESPASEQRESRGPEDPRDSRPSSGSSQTTRTMARYCD